MGNKKSKIKPETLIELTETTHFSNKDIIEFYKEFMKSHPTGYMDLEQYKQIYRYIIWACYLICQITARTV